jgi:hypothetical protein
MVLLGPLTLLVEKHNEEYVWLCTTQLVCAGIDALDGFYGNGSHGSGTFFCRFVEAFMDPGFRQKALDKKGKSKTYCEHLKNYFRHGLTHGFSIEYGVLSKAAEQGGNYLSQNGSNGISVCPEMLVIDFRQAVDSYFSLLVQQGEHSTIGKNFMNRFESIRKQESERS